MSDNAGSGAAASTAGASSAAPDAAGVAPSAHDRLAARLDEMLPGKCSRVLNHTGGNQLQAARHIEMRLIPGSRYR